MAGMAGIHLHTESSTSEQTEGVRRITAVTSHIQLTHTDVSVYMMNKSS